MTYEEVWYDVQSGTARSAFSMTMNTEKMTPILALLPWPARHRLKGRGRDGSCPFPTLRLSSGCYCDSYEEVFPLRIVVVGAGKLGYSIAELLSHEQFDIVVVDHDEERLEVVRNTLDVLTILANGASPVTMDDPDIHGSDLLVACTATDEVNLVTCILAKKHGIKYTAVRIRDMQFLTGAKDYLKKNFDIDLVINPEMITAREINRILLTPAALNVEDFANGKVRLFETKITRHSPLVNVPFKNMNMPPSVLVGMIFRDQL